MREGYQNCSLLHCVLNVSQKAISNIHVLGCQCYGSLMRDLSNHALYAKPSSAERLLPPETRALPSPGTEQTLGGTA